MSRDPYTGRDTAPLPLFAGEAGPSPTPEPSVPASAAKRALVDYLDAWGEEPTTAEAAAWGKHPEHAMIATVTRLALEGEVVMVSTRTCRSTGRAEQTWRVK